jgi:beta-xylosidase
MRLQPCAALRSSRSLNCLPILLWVHLQLFAQITTSVAGASVGPAIASNFPDPSLALDTQNGTQAWYAFSTQTKEINIQVASSPDFSNWTLHEGYEALPKLPNWTMPAPHARVWAPDVNQQRDGTWVMYFAAVGKTHPHKHCIGVAKSAKVEGPYEPLQQPLVCDLDRGGVIDPNLFFDPVDELPYLVYKVDGNAIGHGGACSNTKNPIVPTPLYMQLMNSHDLTTTVGQPKYLFSNIGSFKEDGPNVERPSLLFRNNTYWLTYNAHCFASLEYRIDCKYLFSVVSPYRLSDHLGLPNHIQC